MFSGIERAYRYFSGRERPPSPSSSRGASVERIFREQSSSPPPLTPLISARVEALSGRSSPSNELVLKGEVEARSARELCALMGKRVEEIETLIIRNLTLQNLPEWIGEFTQLKHLVIAGCRTLTTLPESLGELQYLESLQMQFCAGLETLPESIGNLRALKRVRLLGCPQIRYLPHSFSSLRSLHEIELAGVKGLESLPDDLGELLELRKCVINGAEQLSALPSSIGRLGRLEELTLFNCLRLEELGEEIGQLQALHTLRLDGCSALTHLPDCIRDLPNLKKIGIEGSGIRQAEVGRLLGTDPLSLLIEEWKKEGKVAQKWPKPTWSAVEREMVLNWLVRARMTKEYELNRSAVAAVICSILETAHKDSSFASTFFALVASDLVRCGNRAAMSINQVYTAWRLHILPSGVPFEQKRALFTSAARTYILRDLVMEQFVHCVENVELLLFVESSLRTRLNLLSCITTTSVLCEERGKSSGIDLHTLIKQVEQTPLAPYLLRIEGWEACIKQHCEEEMVQIEERRALGLEALEEKRDTLSSSAYLTEIAQLRSRYEEEVIALTEKLLKH